MFLFKQNELAQSENRVKNTIFFYSSYKIHLQASSRSKWHSSLVPSPHFVRNRSFSLTHMQMTRYTINSNREKQSIGAINFRQQGPSRPVFTTHKHHTDITVKYCETWPATQCRKFLIEPWSGTVTGLSEHWARGLHLHFVVGGMGGVFWWKHSVR